ncbi:hypothetical protein PF008_g3858 [Phytophthora fragariae]|uniref:Uncharacterized protein n=1 Tax=Phytophthora fragariae TaxID=53985 RepID=A0A6G0SD62_9STRA|nr:hypothetical protein PF008_g3858 [Phytophthora fragariae]
MADYLFLKSKHEGLPHLGGAQLQSRWRTYIKKFRETLDISLHQTGMGLTNADIAKGITTIEEKLEHMCPEFSRMKVVFGELPNIRPAGTVELGIPSVVAKRIREAETSASACTNTADESSSTEQDTQMSSNYYPGAESDTSTNYGDDVRAACVPRARDEALPDLVLGLCFRADEDSAEQMPTSNDAQQSPAKPAGSLEPLPLSTEHAHDPMNELIPAASLFDAIQSGNVDELQFTEGSEAVRAGARRSTLVQDLFNISSTSSGSSDSEEENSNQQQTALTAAPTKTASNRKNPQRQSGSEQASSRRTAASKRSGTKRKPSESGRSAKKNGSKKTRTSAHQKNVSLAEAHLEVSLKKQEMHQGYLREQLKFIKKKWTEEKSAMLQQQQIDRERREEEAKARKATERHQIFLALINQGKTPSEIKELLQVYDNQD